MPRGWTQFHATGGGRFAWETGFPSEVRIGSMHAAHPQALGHGMARQMPGRANIPEQPWGRAIGAVGATIRSGQQAYGQRQAAIRKATPKVGTAPAAPAVGATTATITRPPTPGEATSPVEWGASFVNKPGLISDITSRMASFAQVPKSPTTPPTALRPSPIRRQRLKPQVPGQTALWPQQEQSSLF